MPEAAVGAISAACVAALFSVLGLIITKEQKISEFRQSWVDSLRNDLSTYIAQINSIIDLKNATFESEEKRVELLNPLFTALNTSSFSIQLRLNWRESASQKVISSMLLLRQAILAEPYTSHDDLRKAEQQLIISAQLLLKSEWERVKSGERTFRWAKTLAVFLFLALLVWTGISALNIVGGMFQSGDVRSPGSNVTVRISLGSQNE